MVSFYSRGAHTFLTRELLLKQLAQHDLPIQNVFAEGLRGRFGIVALALRHKTNTLTVRGEINGKYWGKMSFCMEVVGFQVLCNATDS